MSPPWILGPMLIDGPDDPDDLDPDLRWDSHRPSGAVVAAVLLSGLAASGLLVALAVWW